VDLALAFSALMLGLAGAPHCTAMCGAACAAATRGGSSAVWPFHLMRVAAYASAGALAAAGVGALSALGQVSPALRPLWTLAHAAALALGLWLLWHGRQPAWLQNLGRAPRLAAVPDAQGWQRMQVPLRASAAGAVWVAWPCGLLQSAIVVAGLANTAASGAAVMAVFAAASSVGLVAAPWLLRRLGGANNSAAAVVLATRTAGALLALASAWALSRDVLPRVIEYCFG
jgi:sulfite exporter TauE/SafE